MFEQYCVCEHVHDILVLCSADINLYHDVHTCICFIMCVLISALSGRVNAFQISIMMLMILQEQRPMYNSYGSHTQTQPQFVTPKMAATTPPKAVRGPPPAKQVSVLPGWEGILCKLVSTLLFNSLSMYLRSH